jgi:Cdc6-like AAA superfamily ATPase
MKLVNITGQRGIGKTEVALRVAEYARERYAFSRLLFLEMNTIGAEGAESICLERLAAAFRIPLPASVDIDSIVEAIRRSLRQDEQVMLLLDGIDFWLRKKRDFLVALVGRLRQRLGDLWIVLTSQQNVFHCLPRLWSHLLRRLKLRHAEKSSWRC